jgi:quinoprotein glucose dehydrogenase
MIAAVDLGNRQLVWTRPLGSARDSGPMGIASHLPITMGVPLFGGAMTTRSGLIFVGATQDHFIRALDSRTGRELWKARLPVSGNATPMTYEAGGRQFVVIAAGGHLAMGGPKADYIIAYALPQ